MFCTVERSTVRYWAVASIGLAAWLFPGRVEAQRQPLAPAFNAAQQFEPILKNPSRYASLRRLITLDLNGAPLNQALQTIARAGEVGMMYGEGVLNTKRQVSIHATRVPLVDVLREVLDGSGLDALISADGQSILVRARSDASVPKQQGAIHGTVIDAKTHEPVAGAQVSIEGTKLGAMTGERGAYRIANVPPGTYTIYARRLGYGRGSQSVVVSESGDATVDFSLEKSATQLEQVVTTGTLIPTEVRALPTPITVITAEDIERQHPRRFDELLRMIVPGAVVWEPDASTGEPSALSINLRGMSSLGSLGGTTGNSNPKIYIDGIEIGRMYELSIDPQSVERVEVVRGPQAAAIYGSDAMGGVIQIFTKHGANASQRPEIEAQAGLGRIESEFRRSGTLRQEYTAGISGRSNQASYRVGGGYRRTGAWMPEYSESTPNLNGGMRFEQGGINLNLSARIEQVTSTRGLNTILAATGYSFCNLGCSKPWNTQFKNRYETYGLQIGFQPVKFWQNDVTVGTDRTAYSSVQYKPRNLYPGDTLLSAAEGDYQRLSIAYHTSVSATMANDVKATLMGGADHYTYNASASSANGAITTTPLLLGPNGSTTLLREQTKNTGVFGQAQFSWHDALFLTGSLRFEDNTDFGPKVSWPRSTKVGITYVRDVHGTTVKLRTSYGEAIRPPFFGARDSSEVIPGYYIQLSNPDLRPERQNGPDGGIDVAFGNRGTVSVTYYDQTARDFLYTNNLTFTPPYLSQWQNLARVKNTGWEFEGTLTLARITGRGNFAITHSRPEDLGPIPPDATLQVGRQLMGIPEHTAGLTLTGALLRTTSLTLGASYYSGGITFDALGATRCSAGTGPCKDNFDEYYVSYPGVTKFNLTLDHQLARFVGTYLNIEDLTSEGTKRGYVNTRGTPGRISTLGVRIKY